jgi:hypothetical protein
MTEETTIELLTHALKRAADAHGQHEQQTGRPDPDWPSRYAEHMTRTLGEDGYRLVVSDPH